MQNRRNYYRLLQVQPDAAAEVIKASYRTLMQKLRLHPDLGGDEWNATLLNEAYTVLSDPQRRARYDAARTEARMGLGPGGRTHRPPRSPLNAGSRATGEFEALTCPLCRTLNNVPVNLPEARRCSTCDSPLARVERSPPDVPGGRAVPRLERRLPVRFATARADDLRAGEGVAMDLSCHGMRFVTATPLPEGQLLRLECDLLSAVARVVTCREDAAEPPRYVVGIAFVTVEFASRKGSLFEVRA